MGTQRNEIKKKWIDCVLREGNDRGLLIDDKSEDDDFWADLIIDQTKIVKVRVSLEQKRNYSEIFYGSDEEVKNLNQYSMDINTHLIDSRSGGLDLNEDHFIPITEEILRRETHKEGKASFEVYGNGRYEEPYDSLADSWEKVFDGCGSIL